MAIAAYEQLGQLVAASNKVLIAQANNPDGDSLASALALEEILSGLKKEVQLYCGTPISNYLKYLPGNDRVFDHYQPVDLGGLLLTLAPPTFFRHQQTLLWPARLAWPALSWLF